jgi:hypothetical protein
MIEQRGAEMQIKDQLRMKVQFDYHPSKRTKN